MNLFLLNIYLYSKQKYLSLSLLVLMALFNQQVKAQISSYSYVTAAGTYTAVTGTTIVAAGTDDGNSTNQNIGFTFNFGGTNFTQFIANSNGHIRFGTTASTSNYNPISTTSNTDAIAAVARDGKATGDVILTLQGSAPNRVCVIQYTNFDLIYNATTKRVSFQIRLYETTNVVEIIYTGAVGNTTTSTVEVGLRGTSTASDFRNCSGSIANWNNLPAGTANTNTVAWGSSQNGTRSMPSNGRILRWTPPSCSVPSAINASAITSTTATIAWTAASPAPTSGYQWEVRSSGAAGSGATGLAASGSTAAGVVTANATGLTANTTYSIYVRSNCAGSGFSAWTSAVTFFTGYCTPAPTSVDGSGITNVTMGTINNTTGVEAGNYGNYSAQITNVTQGNVVACNITYSTGYTYDTKIWVDWNNDLDFNDAGEEVYVGVSTATNPTTLAASFTVPIAATAGNHIVRIGGVDTGPPTTCYTGTYGSFEDYTINVQVAVACSGTPTAGTAAATPTNLCTTGSVALSLTGYTSGASGITFQWQSSPNNSSWTNISGATTANYTVTSVSAMTYYRCVVTCTNGGGAANSNSVQVTFGTPLGATFASPIAVGTLGCTAYSIL